MSYISKLTPNNEGRDFVVGSLHGHYRQLRLMLARLAFNPHTDRLLCTGNLINYGQDSYACLSLIQENWFYAVRGEFEDMFLSRTLQRGNSLQTYDPDIWETTSRGWDKDVPSPNILIDLARKVHKLPLIIHVEGLFNVVHSEIWATKEGLPATDPDIVNCNFTRVDAIEMISGNNVVSAAYEIYRPELSWVFSGRTPVRDIQLKNKHALINTGVYAGGYLTIAEVKSKNLIEVHRLDAKSEAFTSVQVSLISEN